MATGSQPRRPAELDAGPVQTPERVLLASPPSTPGPRRELAIYRETVNGRLLRVDEVTYSDDDTQPARDRVERFLDLTQDGPGVVPLYAIARQPRAEWIMQFIYKQGVSQVAYSLRERRDAFQLQKLLTGYAPSAFYENVTCSVIFKNTTGKLSGLRRDERYEGSGEIQLWWPEMGRSELLSPVPSTTSGESSSRGGSVPSTTRRAVGGTSILSIQTDFNGREIWISELPRPPLLVAFLKDKTGDGYTMLRTDLTRLQYPKPHDDRIFLQSPSRKTFTVERLSEPKQRLDSWNLCAFDGESSAVKQLKCTYFNLRFEGADTPSPLKQFETSLLRLQYRRRKLEAERLTALARHERENRDRDVTRISTAPTSAASMSPMSPLDTNRMSMPTIMTVSPHSPTAPTFQSLPAIRAAGTLGTEIFAELEQERPSRELEGTPVTGPFEMDYQDDGPAGRTELQRQTRW